MEYAAGGDLSESVQKNKLPGVRCGAQASFCCPEPCACVMQSVLLGATPELLSERLSISACAESHKPSVPLADTGAEPTTTEPTTTTRTCSSLCKLLCAVQMGLAEADARWLFQQLIIAVDYCHRLGIANRDIKVPLLRLYVLCSVTAASVPACCALVARRSPSITTALELSVQ